MICEIKGPGFIVALRNEKGSYSQLGDEEHNYGIVALRNEKGSYSALLNLALYVLIVALRNEKGSYSQKAQHKISLLIVALRNDELFVTILKMAISFSCSGVMEEIWERLS